eukprot:m.376018 g.376018  ORF g.376018 m.376018 type:complete len:192 (-) comp56185_c0_seq8:193-768(-)
MQQKSSNLSRAVLADWWRRTCRLRTRSCRHNPATIIFCFCRDPLPPHDAGDHPALFTLFGSNHLKTHLTTIENSEAFYSKHLGSELLAPPFGSADRLKTFPALEGKQFEIQGAGQRQVSTDIVLGGVGWLSLTYAYQQRMTVKAWTPKGLGLFTRPALDQLAVNQHGPILPQSKFEVRRTRPVQTLKSWRR